MMTGWVEKCWSLVIGEECLTMEIKRYLNKVYKIYGEEKESRHKHYNM